MVPNASWHRPVGQSAHHAGHLAADAAAGGGGVGADQVVRRLHRHHVQRDAQLVGTYLSHLAAAAENSGSPTAMTYILHTGVDS